MNRHRPIIRLSAVLPAAVARGGDSATEPGPGPSRPVEPNLERAALAAFYHATETGRTGSTPTTG